MTLLLAIRAMEEPTFSVAALGKMVIVDASLHAQLAELAPMKLRIETQSNVLKYPALLVAALKVTITVLPILSNTAEASIGTAGIRIPAASVAWTVGLAVGVTVGDVVGTTVGAVVGDFEGNTVGCALGSKDGPALGTVVGCVEGPAVG